MFNMWNYDAMRAALRVDDNAAERIQKTARAIEERIRAERLAKQIAANKGMN